MVPDPVGFLRAFFVARASGTMLAGVPIRGGNLEPGDEPPAVLLMESGSIHDRNVPWQTMRVEVRVYGGLGPDGPRIASELYRTVSGLAHGAGPLTINGTTIARMFEEVGPQPASDSTTHWAEVFGVIALEGPDRVLPT